MLRLENVEIRGNMAQADYYPETETQSGFIRVDLETEEIVELTTVAGYETMYPAHALRTLVRMANEGDTSTTRTTRWY